MEQGTVKNGVIVPDNPLPLSEGMRINFVPAEAESWPGVDYPYHETREEILASIRESIAEIEAGVPGLPVDEAFAKIRAELDLTLSQDE